MLYQTFPWSIQVDVDLLVDFFTIMCKTLDPSHTPHFNRSELNICKLISLFQRLK